MVGNFNAVVHLYIYLYKIKKQKKQKKKSNSPPVPAACSICNIIISGDAGIIA